MWVYSDTRHSFRISRTCGGDPDQFLESGEYIGYFRTCGGDPQRLLQSNKVTLVFPAHAGDDLKTLPNFYLQNLGNIS